MGALCTQASLWVGGQVTILSPQTLLGQLKSRGQVGMGNFSMTPKGIENKPRLSETVGRRAGSEEVGQWGQPSFVGRARASEPANLGMNLATAFSELTSLVYEMRRVSKHSGFSLFTVVTCYKVAVHTELATTEPSPLRETQG